ncbi:cytochrome C oxidase subunit IV family protein [Ruegeria lacuscaerulensis]|uniref:cytochrome C oxidase subunit IV family protein n=1 Tax=Ruegeria lacuscaerulensis TaxID=55218 RepID=UPI00147B0009|nr:cytochrome C oxidase subunit IV family protein [Ruegeria lacuscaerulensis]
MKGAHGYHLTRAWLALLALSLGSASLTVLHLPVAVLGAGILLLALIKARVILAQYLDLTHSPAWLRGFTAVFAAFSILIFALYLI